MSLKTHETVALRGARNNCMLTYLTYLLKQGQTDGGLIFCQFQYGLLEKLKKQKTEHDTYLN